MSKVPTSSVPPRVCDVFEQGCMYCANKPGSVFNPESFPQKMHIAEMSYCSPQGTLYVRETTAEVEKAPGDDYVALPDKTPEPLAANALEQALPSYFKGLKQSCSGITFVEEKEERARDAVYKATLKNKLEERALWRAFVKHIEKSKKLQKVKDSGPEWYQELSANQLSLLDTLHSVLKADSDEKSISYTKRFLTEMGITPTLESKHIEKAVLDCELDSMYFLARIQKEVNTAESKKAILVSELSNFKRKKRAFTVSERILLSAIVYLHMPILLFKLHLILPSPVEGRKSGKLKNVLAPLPATDKLPDPKKEWFKPPDTTNQEFESVISDPETMAVDDSKVGINKQVEQVEDSPSIWTMVSIPPTRDRKSDFFNADGSKPKDTRISENKDGKKLQDQKLEERRHSVKDVQDPTTFPSFQSFYQGMEPCDSVYFIMESFTQTNVSFHENQPVLRPGKVKRYDSLTEKLEEEVTDLLPASCHKPADRIEKLPTVDQYCQTDHQWLPPDTKLDVIEFFGPEYAEEVIQRSGPNDKGINTEFPLKGKLDLEDEIAILIATIVRKPTENELLRKEMLQKCLQENDIDALYSIFGLEKSEKTSSSGPSAVKKPKTKRPSVTKRNSSASQKSQTSSQRSLKEEAEDELEVFLLKIKEEVRKKRTQNQLKVALKILAAAGDPVSDFPDVQKHPVIRRWYEIRRGIKRRLSEREKANLTEKSRKAWNCLLSKTNELKPPKMANLTPKQLASFTWDRRLWIKKQAEMVQAEYTRELRQALVDDARTCYPTMCTDYYDSKLNQNLRQLFFTYLPAKENDYYVFKQWKPIETKSKKENNQQ